MKWSLIAVGSLGLAACSGPTQEQIAEATRGCEEFVASKMTYFGSGNLKTKVFDTWTKDGAIVVKVGYQGSSEGSSYAVRTCVYDKARGQITIPSPMNEAQWRR